MTPVRSATTKKRKTGSRSDLHHRDAEYSFYSLSSAFPRRRGENSESFFITFMRGITFGMPGNRRWPG
jgi:hypothetical protein